MKLYLVTRRDLPPGLRAAQLCHAVHEFLRDHPSQSALWYEQSRTIVCLEVQDEAALHALVSRCSDTEVSVWREPDLANEVTAVAIGPRGARLCRNLRLALDSSVSPVL
jgi:peptidyl-tRNA hydrolase